MARRKRRKFNPEFKAEAVRLARLGDRSIEQIANDLDLTESSLRNWVRQAEVDADEAPAGNEGLATAEKAELAELRREVKKLRQERDILKAAALNSGGEDNSARARSSDRLHYAHHQDTRIASRSATRALGAMEEWAITQRHCPCSREAPRLYPYLSFCDGGHRACRTTAQRTGIVVERARGGFAWPSVRRIDTSDRSHSRPSAVHRKPRSYAEWWPIAVSGDASGFSSLACRETPETVQAREMAAAASARGWQTSS